MPKSEYVSQYETKKTETEFEIMGIFPTPVYVTNRGSTLDSTEEQEIKEIIEGEMQKTRPGVSGSSLNSYIFNTKLKNIRRFCEKHAEIYIKEVINPDPVQNIIPYITQSWLNLSSPGDVHFRHHHSNSILSGVFYISTVEDDKITFFDPNSKIKNSLRIDTVRDGDTIWNADNCSPAIDENTLLIFPSWLEHGVMNNPLQTRDRISLSFNIFIKGNLGTVTDLNELKLEIPSEYKSLDERVYRTNQHMSLEGIVPGMP